MDKKRNIYNYPHFQEIIFHLLSGAETYCDETWDSKYKIQNDEFNRLYCIIEGEAFIEGCKGRLKLEPGYIYLIPGQYKFSYRCPESMLLLWVHFQLDFLPGMDVFQSYETKSLYQASETDFENFRYILSNITTQSPQMFLELYTLLLKLLKPFLPVDWQTIQPEPENVKRLKPALELMNKRFNQPFNLGMIAKTVKMNPASMSDLFRRTFKISPSSYVMKLRLRQAQNLLLTTDRRISEIAIECGFNDPLYFSRIFRKRFQFSPRKFRQNRKI